MPRLFRSHAYPNQVITDVCVVGGNIKVSNSKKYTPLLAVRSHWRRWILQVHQLNLSAEHFRKVWRLIGAWISLTPKNFEALCSVRVSFGGKEFDELSSQRLSAGHNHLFSLGGEGHAAFMSVSHPMGLVLHGHSGTYTAHLPGRR